MFHRQLQPPITKTKLKKPTERGSGPVKAKLGPHDRYARQHSLHQRPALGGNTSNFTPAAPESGGPARPSPRAHRLRSAPPQQPTRARHAPRPQALSGTGHSRRTGQRLRRQRPAGEATYPHLGGARSPRRRFWYRSRDSSRAGSPRGPRMYSRGSGRRR